MLDVEFTWFKGNELTLDQLQECSDLFSSHYGSWSKNNPIAKMRGKSIKLSPDKLKELVAKQSGYAAFARYGNELVGYAFVSKGNLGKLGTIAWVTQLVVHTDYRKQEIATRLLKSIWGFTNDFAWGLVTANPYTVRTLETTTRRRCDPKIIKIYKSQLKIFGTKHISYLKGSNPSVGDNSSVINTEFFIDHSDIPKMVKTVTTDTPWLLGEALEEGYEWFAFTFRSQGAKPMTTEDLQGIHHESEKVVMRAYDNMDLSDKHTWRRYTPHEIDIIIAALDMKIGDKLLDFGCGDGRHALLLAEKGYSVIGIDNNLRYIDEAKRNANKRHLKNVTFYQGDCRTWKSEMKFDIAICLYDVIGSYPSLEENKRILQNLVYHVKQKGRVALSVMNFEATLSVAKFVADVDENPDVLRELKPSTTMQDSGNIFDPDYFVVDPKSQIVYRKEQFTSPNMTGLPEEIIVLDRRFRIDEIIPLCKEYGLSEIRCFPVQSGRWDVNLNASDRHAKEIVYFGEKID